MRLRLLGVVLLGLGIALACADPLPPPMEAPSLGQPTEAQVKDLSSRVLASSRKGDLADLQRLVDEPTLLALGLQGLPLDEEILQDMAADFDPATELQRSLVAPVSQGDRIRVLREEATPEGTWVRLRVIRADGSFDHAALLVSLVRGTPRIVDLYTLTEGQRTSASVRHTLTLVAREDGYLQGEEFTRAEPMSKMIHAIEAGDTDTALEAWDALAEDIRAQCPVHLTRVGLVSRLPLEDPRRAGAVQDFLDTCPEHPAATIAALDLARRLGDPARAATLTEVLHEREGPDAYILVLEAAAWLDADQPQRAGEVLERAQELEPTLLEVHTQRLAVSIATGDHDGTLAELRALERDFAWEFGDSLEREQVGGFVDSAEYQEWQRRER